MHKYIFQLSILLSLGFSSAWIGLRSDTPKAVEPMVVSSDIQETYLDFQFEGYHMLEVETPNGIEYIIDLQGGSSILESGAPDIDKWTSSIIIPDQGSTSIEIISSSYHEYSDISIAPSKGNFSRMINPSDVAYFYGDVYQEDNFFLPLDPKFFLLYQLID